MSQGSVAADFAPFFFGEVSLEDGLGLFEEETGKGGLFEGVDRVLLLSLIHI